MKVEEFISCFDEFDLLNKGRNMDEDVTEPYCCDLLSIAMGRMPQGAAWVTVMANVNALAVASLADAACIILAEGSSLDEFTIEKAREGYYRLRDQAKVFDAALLIYNRLNA